MVHGMRNDSRGAAVKVSIAAERLKMLGYEHTVIGFSYDSNIKGAHIKRRRAETLRVAHVIARRNGQHLAAFIADVHEHGGVVRLMAHSLGSEVVLSAISVLHGMGTHDLVKSVHFFAASITRDNVLAHMESVRDVVQTRVTNYYGPDDAELCNGHDAGLVSYPVGLCGLEYGIPGWRDVMVHPENHRFASYAATLDSFP